MIGKRVRNPNVSATKVVRIKKLTDYILKASETDGKAKCVYSGYRGLSCKSTKSRQTEMMALASSCIKSKDPIRHYVLSFKEGEHPSPEQIEDAIDILVSELGLENHQLIFGLHDDTDNFHCHLAVNLVNPETNKVVKPNGGFDIEALHRAVARIEHKQGWTREPNGRYFVQSDGSLSARPEAETKKQQPKQSNKDIECQTGTKSAERLGIEDAGPILRTAKSWSELHQRLGQKGMRYEKVGSGAVVFVGTTAIKASSCDRNGGLSKLIKRLGDWTPSSEIQAEPQKQDPVPMVPSKPWVVFIKMRSVHYESKRYAKDELKAKHARERSDLFKASKAERNEVYRVSWRGVGIMRVAFCSVLAARHAVAKIELRERQAVERKCLGNQYAKWPSFEDWLESQSLADDAQSWRYRSDPAGAPCSIRGGNGKLCVMHDLRDFTPKMLGREVHYQNKTSGNVGFIDKGRRIVLSKSFDDGTVLAALQLAAQKWGTFTVNGSADYKSMCASLAVKYGFKIENPELQHEIEMQRDKFPGFNNINSKKTQF